MTTRMEELEIIEKGKYGRSTSSAPAAGQSFRPHPKQVELAEGVKTSPQQKPAEDYSSLMPAAPNAAHEELRKTVEEYTKVCEFLERYEALVDRGKKRKKELEEEVLPEIMEVKCLQSEAKYPDGLKIVIKTDYYANIPSQSHINKLKDRDEAQRLQEKLDAAMAWIDENAPAVIKRRFEIDFGKEDKAWADKFERDLAKRKRPLPVNRLTTVHPQTLNALVRDLIAEDHQVPRDVLGVYERKVAKVTLPVAKEDLSR